VFDTPARPNSDDLEALVDGCDLLIIPTTPDISIDAIRNCRYAQQIEVYRYRILLTIIPSAPRNGENKPEKHWLTTSI